MTGGDELIREITCPVCQTTFDADFPRGTEIVSIDTGADNAPSIPTEKQRRKRLQKDCPQGHVIIVTYDW